MATQARETWVHEPQGSCADAPRGLTGPTLAVDLCDDVLGVVASFLPLADTLVFLSLSRSLRALLPFTLSRQRHLQLSAALGSDGDGASLLLMLRANARHLRLERLDCGRAACGGTRVYQFGGENGSPARLRPVSGGWYVDTVSLVRALPLLHVPAPPRPGGGPLSKTSFAGLRELDLSGLCLSNAALRLLHASPLEGLETLDVSGVMSWPDAEFGRPPAAPPRFAARLKTLRREHADLVLRRWWRLRDFSSLEEFSGHIAPTEVDALGSLAHLHKLALVRTRVCEMRMHKHCWRALLARLTTLRLVECDLMPRAHLFQESSEVLREMLALAPNLRSLCLLRTPDADDARPNAVRLDDALLAAAFSTLASRSLCELRLHPADRISDVGLRTVIDKLGDRLRVVALTVAGVLPTLAGPAAAEDNGGREGFLSRGFERPEGISDTSLYLLAARCPLLEELSAHFCPLITDAGVQALARGRCGARLCSLNLTRASLFSAATLRELHTRCFALRELRVRGCHAAAAQPAGVAAIDDLRRRGVRVYYTQRPRVPADGETATCLDDWQGSARDSGPLFSFASERTAQTAALASNAPVDGAGARVPEACVHGCGAAVRPADAADHATFCGRAPCRCPVCFDAVPRRDGLPRHWERECREYLVACQSAGPEGACSAWRSRADVCAHRAEHAAALERAAARARCGAACDGCAFVESPLAARSAAAARLGGAPRPRLSAWAHVSSGDCAHAAFVCLSCGSPCGSRPQHGCGTALCAAAGLLRARMPHAARRLVVPTQAPPGRSAAAAAAAVAAARLLFLGPGPAPESPGPVRLRVAHPADGALVSVLVPWPVARGFGLLPEPGASCGFTPAAQAAVTRAGFLRLFEAEAEAGGEAEAEAEGAGFVPQRVRPPPPPPPRPPPPLPHGRYTNPMLAPAARPAPALAFAPAARPLRGRGQWQRPVREALVFEVRQGQARFERRLVEDEDEGEGAGSVGGDDDDGDDDDDEGA